MDKSVAEEATQDDSHLASTTKQGKGLLVTLAVILFISSILVSSLAGIGIVYLGRWKRESNSQNLLFRKDGASLRSSTLEEQLPREMFIEKLRNGHLEDTDGPREVYQGNPELLAILDEIDELESEIQGIEDVQRRDEVRQRYANKWNEFMNAVDNDKLKKAAIFEEQQP